MINLPDINVLLKLVGIREQPWLMSSHMALPAIIIFSVWKTVGYNMIIYLAALQGVPEALYEAASIDGAGRMQRFWSITIPMIVWVMISFFEDIHPELEEAALVDGCSIGRAFASVSLPLARPGIAVAAILAFIQSWNNFIFGAVLAGRETRTLPVAVFNSMTYEQLSWGPLAAAALSASLVATITCAPG
jgi:ABC-type sugar transport system permease subunit